MTFFRRLTGSFELSGVGLHSGRECRLRVSPAKDGIFLAAEGQELPISRLALEGTGRGSDYIFPDGHRIRTCEHILAALTGMGIWQARLEVEGGEMPALDGCAGQTAEEILKRSEPCGEEEEDRIFDFDDAVEAALNKNPAVDICEETEDAFIFSWPELREAPSFGESAIVILKEGGEVMNYTAYLSMREEMGLGPVSEAVVAKYRLKP